MPVFNSGILTHRYMLLQIASNIYGFSEGDNLPIIVTLLFELLVIIIIRKAYELFSHQSFKQSTKLDNYPCLCMRYTNF